MTWTRDQFRGRLHVQDAAWGSRNPEEGRIMLISDDTSTSVSWSINFGDPKVCRT